MTVTATVRRVERDRRAGGRFKTRGRCHYVVQLTLDSGQTYERTRKHRRERMRRREEHRRERVARKEKDQSP